MTNPKLKRALAFLRGESVKREKSRYILDNPVRKMDVPLSTSEVQSIVSNYYGRRNAQ